MLSTFRQHRVIIVLSIIVASLGLLTVFELGLDRTAAYIAVPFLWAFPRASILVPLGIVCVGYLTLRKWSGLAGTALGLILVWVLAIGIPARVNPEIIAQDRALLANDMSLKQPVELTGVIGIIASPLQYQAPKSVVCEELCLSLLYSGKVSGVVMAKAKDATAGEARLWTVIKEHAPCSIEINPRTTAVWGYQLNASAARNRALLGECLRSQPADIVSANFIVEGEVIGNPATREDTSLLNPPASGSRLSLWRRGSQGLILLGRDTELNHRQLQSPLHFTIGGGAFSGPYLVLARGHTEGSNLPDIRRFINLANLKIEEPSPTEIRARLDDWLNDTGRRDPKATMTLHGAVMRLMRGDTVEPGDLDRYRRMILDRDGDGIVIESAIRQFPDQTPILLNAAIARIAALPPKSKDQRRIAQALTTFPPGTFTRPSAQLLDLLHDPQRAALMATLLERLAEDNANNAPLMMSLLVANFPSESKPEPEGATMGTAAFIALRQLCRIGPPAARYLPEIESLVGNHRTIFFMFDGSLQWAIIRLRMGKPAAEIVVSDRQADEWEGLLKRHVKASDCVI